MYIALEILQKDGVEEKKKDKLKTIKHVIIGFSWASFLSIRQRNLSTKNATISLMKKDKKKKTSGAHMSRQIHVN